MHCVLILIKEIWKNNFVSSLKADIILNDPPHSQEWCRNVTKGVATFFVVQNTELRSCSIGAWDFKRVILQTQFFKVPNLITPTISIFLIGICALLLKKHFSKNK